MRNPNLTQKTKRERLRGFVLKAANGHYMNASGKLVESIEDAAEYTTPIAAIKAAHEKHYKSGALTASLIITRP